MPQNLKMPNMRTQAAKQIKWIETIQIQIYSQHVASKTHCVQLIWGFIWAAVNPHAIFGI